MDTFDNLRSLCLTVLDRETDPLASDFFTVALKQTEDEIFLRLRCPWNTRVAQFVWSLADGPFEYLPPSYSSHLALLDATNGRSVDPIGPADMEAWLGRAGGGKFAVIITGLMLQIVPMPTENHPFILYYYSRQEPLSEEHPVNDILNKCPTMYFNGVAGYMAKLYGEAETSAEHLSTFSNLIEAANSTGSDWIRNVNAGIATPGGP